MRIPELLIPVGGPELLSTALAFGADAVYLGSEALSLRARAHNFSLEDLKKALGLTHELKRKLYLTVNIFAREEDLAQGIELFQQLAAWEEKPDGLIISDPGLIALSRQLCPDIPLHLSTQANTTNSESLRFWYGQGIRRAVLARELSLREIQAINEHTPEDLELELFVHGSMCMSYSGRCLISSFLTGRDANRGDCAQPCRWSYALMEERRPGQYMPVEETERGTYLFNSRDLCMIDHLPELIRAGAACLKVEGRMKNELYVATVTRAYRRALDALKESEAAYRDLLPWCREELLKITTRAYCSGFFFGPPGEAGQKPESSSYRQDYRYLGRIQGDEKGLYILQKNKFSAGDLLEAIGPGDRSIPFTVSAFETESGEIRKDCPHPGEKLYLHTNAVLHINDIIREKKHGSH